MQGRVLAIHVIPAETQRASPPRHPGQDCEAVAVAGISNTKSWYFSFEEKLYILDSIPAHIDVTITSTTAGFVRYALLQDRTALHITGSIAVAETLQQLLGNLDIDWEEELSKHTGDVIAHQAMRFMQNLRTIELDQMVAEYLQEEIKVLPTKTEMQEYLHAVDQLRSDVDRIEARIKQYAHDR